MISERKHQQNDFLRVKEAYSALGIDFDLFKESIDDRKHSRPEMDNIIKSLGSDPANGLSEKTRSQREEAFGRNELPSRPPPSFFKLLIAAYKDKMLILLTIAAIASTAIGIYQDVTTGEKGWLEGVAIMVAVLLVVFVNTINDYRKELQFQALSERNKEHQVRIWIEGSLRQKMSSEIVVGDVVRIETGDLVPADGILIRCDALTCDESAQTGESDAVEKEPGDAVVSGSQVLAGTGDFVAVAIGSFSVNGRLMREIQHAEAGQTPMQHKLGVLSNGIAKLGAAAALLMLASLLVKYFVLASHEPNWPPPGSEILQHVIQIVIQAITIVVVSVPEGLPMAVTIALAYATTRMLQDNNLVRHLGACETMGCATTICSDKTGTLTQNKMTVTEGVILKERLSSFKAKPDVFKLIARGLSLNSTAFPKEDGAYVGNKTECALLEMCSRLDPKFNCTEERRQNRIAQSFPFSSQTKCSAVLVEEVCPLKGKPVLRVYLKGASEIVLSRCSLQQTPTGSEPVGEREAKQLINEMAIQALRTIGFAYKDVSEAFLDEIPLEGFVLLGIVGIEDPLRPSSAVSVKQCQDAGIFVRMVTGDNVATARAIATRCGILMPGGIVLEGVRFRAMSDPDLVRTLPKLQVLARSTPADKIKLVTKLQEMGHIVAVTGDGTNDGPALRGADVGFAMGITGTEVAKEACDIVLLDDDFGTIVKAVSWGRCVREGVRKFLQFQLSVNVSAVVTAFVTSLAGEKGESSVITAVQLLWINLIMDTFAALALATDPPQPRLLESPPDHPDDSLITYEMKRMIIAQSALQVAVMLTFYFVGYPAAKDSLYLRSFLFNTFVFLQLFNKLNCRIVDDRTLNVFKGLSMNRFFVGIWVGTVAVQVVLIFFGGKLFSTTPLKPLHWLICILVGALPLPLGLFVRLMPKWGKGKDRSPMHPTRSELRWQHTIGTIKSNLAFYNALRRPPRLVSN